MLHAIRAASAGAVPTTAPVVIDAVGVGGAHGIVSTADASVGRWMDGRGAARAVHGCLADTIGSGVIASGGGEEGEDRGGQDGGGEAHYC